MAVDEDKSEICTNYAQVVNFLLDTYETDEVIQDANGKKLVDYRQRPSQNEMKCARPLCATASRCGSVTTTNPLKTVFADNVKIYSRSQVRKYLSDTRGGDYDPFTRHAQRIGDTFREWNRTPVPAPT